MKYLAFLLMVGMLVGVLASVMHPSMQDYESRRLQVIDQMNELISEKKGSGEYACCIDPPCDMCFLGHWIWDDGVCRCDKMIAEGKFDKVCPQCQKAVDKSICSSTVQDNQDVRVCEV